MLPAMRVRVLENADILAEFAAAAIARLLREGARSGRVTLGLAGGSTPRATYTRLRDEEVPWERTDAWLSDERWVPPDHADNNGRMAREALLDHVPARFHPVPWNEHGAPEEAAGAYAATVASLTSRAGGGPRPDVILLGMGEDGHTASLFPGTAALDETERLYVANWVETLHTWRLTATYPLLHAARHVLFLVAGEGKAAPLARVLEGEGEPLPARRVMEGEGEVTWLVDRAAARALEATPLEEV